MRGAAFAIAALFGLGLAMPALADEDAAVLSTFVVVGPDGGMTARAITTAPTCPSIDVAGRRQTMTIRAAPETAPQRPARFVGAPAKPAAFPVLTCETILPAKVRSARIGDRKLPLAPARIRRIAVIGDTGCRTPNQACNDPDQFPFASIAATIAAWKPDVVLHVGDYLYRETPCPAASAGCAGSPWGYGFDAWSADFFGPADPLLRAAPWVLVRGNHESCSRAGQGWWRFMDPGPLRPRRDCNDPTDDDIGDYSPPYAVGLGGGRQLIVYDSSNVPPAGGFPPADPRMQRYGADVRRIQSLAARAPHNILADHHPVLGLGARFGADGEVQVYPGNEALQSVFGAVWPSLAPPTVDLLLAGHIHLWEAISFSSPHPAQVIAGFSGTEEDIVPLPLSPGVDPAPGASVETLSSWVAGFGYMTLQAKGRESWRMKVRDVRGHVVNTCDLKRRRLTCAVRQVAPTPAS